MVLAVRPMQFFERCDAPAILEASDINATIHHSLKTSAALIHAPQLDLPRRLPGSCDAGKWVKVVPPLFRQRAELRAGGDPSFDCR